MKKGSLYVDVLDVPVHRRGEVHEGAERFKAGCWHGRFLVVDPETLGESFCDVAHFISYDVSHVIAFAFAHKFPFKRASSARDF